jgi:hypothetical protein
LFFVIQHSGSDADVRFAQYVEGKIDEFMERTFKKLSLGNKKHGTLCEMTMCRE